MLIFKTFTVRRTQNLQGHRAKGPTLHMLYFPTVCLHVVSNHVFHITWLGYNRTMSNSMHICSFTVVSTGRSGKMVAMSKNFGTMISNAVTNTIGSKSKPFNQQH